MSNWISVKNSLPDPLLNVLVISAEKDGIRIGSVIYSRNGKPFWRLADEMPYRCCLEDAVTEIETDLVVTHWQKLPLMLEQDDEPSNCEEVELEIELHLLTDHSTRFKVNSPNSDTFERGKALALLKMASMKIMSLDGENDDG